MVSVISGKLILTFLISILTIGFLTSLLIFDKYHKNTYYFYYNQGYSKRKLLMYSEMINFCLVSCSFWVLSFTGLLLKI